MDNRKNDNYYLEKIVDNINAIEKYIGDKSYEEFVSDDELVDAIMFRFIQMVENINNLTKEYKAAHSNIPWGKIIGFRNGIVHEYGETDFYTVYETIRNDLEELKNNLK